MTRSKSPGHWEEKGRWYIVAFIAAWVALSSRRGASAVPSSLQPPVNGFEECTQQLSIAAAAAFTAASKGPFLHDERRVWLPAVFPRTQQCMKT